MKKALFALSSLLSFQVYAAGTLTIAGLPGAAEEDTPVCYNSGTGQLGNCAGSSSYSFFSSVSSTTSPPYLSTVGVDSNGTEIGIHVDGNTFMSFKGYMFDVSLTSGVSMPVDTILSNIADFSSKGILLFFNNSNCSGTASIMTYNLPQHKARLMKIILWTEPLFDYDGNPFSFSIPSQDVYLPKNLATRQFIGEEEIPPEGEIDKSGLYFLEFYGGG
ncbi:MAG: hypothetical protein KAJ63_14425 [Methyloprofundus sp.]|nr:hypothetical protein [Methyloprofundus sp.]